LYGLPKPTYKYEWTAISITFYKTPQKTPHKTKDKILNLMENNPYITIVDIVEVLGISRDTINEHIARLKKDSLLRRIGGRKSGYWKVDYSK
jgi:ATP-dependent DNA helicase RecG